MNSKEKELILSKLRILDRKIGTPDYADYRRAFIKDYLPKEYHLDFGLWSKKHCITDRYGARVM